MLVYQRVMVHTKKTCCLFDSCLTFSLHELYSQEQKDQEGLGIKHWFQTPSMSKAEHAGICIFLYCGWEEKNTTAFSNWSKHIGTSSMGRKQGQ